MKVVFHSVFVLSLLLGLPLALVAQEDEAKQVELNAGDESPDFTLPASDGNEYTLSELLEEGPVVLAWFPKADTPGCTQECKSIAENGHLIREFNVTYFMISVDSEEDNKKFAEKTHADFPILSDISKEVAEAFGVMSDRDYPSRHTFYIDTDGKILKVDRDVNPGTSAEDIAENLEELEVEKVEETS